MPRKRILSISVSDETHKRWRAVEDSTGMAGEDLLRKALSHLEGPALDEVRTGWKNFREIRRAAGIPDPLQAPRRGRPRKQ
jgi:hypothetical protein